MAEIQSELAVGVRLFLETGDRSFLNILRSMERDDQEGQAAIRYLSHLKHWPHTPESDFAGLLDHFFGHYAERKPVDAQQYRDTTGAMIKVAWDFDCPEFTPTVREDKPRAKVNPGKRTTRPRMQSEQDSVEEGEELSTLETKGASDRLKKVIAIQRGG